MLGLNIDPATLVAVAIFLLVGFPVHEFSHALVAYRLGDGTAKMFGRLTLNPLVHLDPVGSALLVISAVGAGFFIGWAKPTPVNPSMLRGGRRAEAYVAAAGPVSNLLMAAAGALLFRVLDAIVSPGAPDFIYFSGTVILWFVFINVALFIFNLIPIPPLDGSKVLFALLNPRTVWEIRPTLERYGFVILLVVMILPVGDSSLAGRVIMPVMATIVNGLVGVNVLVGF